MKTPYPKNWTEISLKLREAANQTCQRCGKPRSDKILTLSGGRWANIEDGAKRNPDGTPIWHDNRGNVIPTPNEPSNYFGGETICWIIKARMQVAHLGIPKPDGTPGDKEDRLDVRPENLIVLCQGCHLEEDEEQHIKSPYKRRGLMAKKWHQEGKLPPVTSRFSVN